MATSRYHYHKAKSLYHFGVDEWIQDLGLAQAQMDIFCRKTMEVCAEVPESRMREWWITGGHVRRPLTGTLTKLGHRIDQEGTLWIAKIGFDAPSGGFPALFLDVGTPYIEPSYFILSSFLMSLPEVSEIQENLARKLFGAIVGRR